VQNQTHPYYIRIGTASKHHYERGHEVVFDAQLKGGKFAIQQIPAPAFENFEYYFSVLPCSVDCPGVETRFLPPGECVAEEGANDEPVEKCDEVTGCTGFLSQEEPDSDDASCAYSDCPDNQSNYDLSKMFMVAPSVVGLSKATLESARNADFTEVDYNRHATGCAAPNYYVDYIDNAADNSVFGQYLYTCANDEYHPSVLSANMTLFYNKMGYLEINHVEEFMFSTKVSGEEIDCDPMDGI
jgi:hypothetical protein